MKNILTLCFSLVAFAVHAQVNKPYDMMINGVKVIVVPSSNEIVQIDLVIKGGVQNYAAYMAGIEELTLTALTECGTMKDTKNSFKNKVEEVSASIYGSAGLDASHFYLSCIKGDFERVWSLYVDALTIPKFDSKEFSRIKEDAINNLRRTESNPDAALRLMAMQTAFKEMDYSKHPAGTKENIEKFTVADVKAYYRSFLTRSKMFMVVVGDFKKEDLQKKVAALFSKIPAGKPFELKRSTYVPQQNTFVTKQKDIATNYIMGITSAPAANSKEYYPALIASRLFYHKSFLEVRSNNGLSYAPSAAMTSGLTPYSFMYVSTKEPDKYIAVVRNMVDKLKSEGFPAEDVKNAKTSFATRHYYQNETNSSLATMVANAELLQGNWRRAFTLKEDLNAVTPSEVINVFNKYIGNFTWVYQGDPKSVTPTLFTKTQTPPIIKEKKVF